MHWKKMDDYNNKFLPDIWFSCIIPDWFFILQVLILAKSLIENSRLKSDFQQLQEAEMLVATKNLELERENYRLTKENRLLEMEQQNLREELSSISSADAHSSHMTSPTSEIVVVNMAELSPRSTNAAELQTQNALAGGIHSNGNKSRLYSKQQRSRRGLPSKAEKASGRPLPGSIQFLRESRVNLSSSVTKKILAGDYLTFYMGNCLIVQMMIP